MRSWPALITALVLGLLLATLWLWVAWQDPGDPTPALVLDHTRPRPQGGYYVGAYPEPQHLNPFTTWDAVARRAVLRYTHETLLEIDPQSGALRGALAESVEQQDDGMTLVFKLRQDVRFSDGSPMTMDDVLFTWSVAKQEKVPLGAMGEGMQLIKELAAVDGTHLRIRLEEKTFTALGTVATSYVVVKKQYYEQQLQLHRLGEIRFPGPGTGPYQIARDPGTGKPIWRRGRDLLLVQNPHCWRRQVYPESWNLAGFRLLFVRDKSAQFTLLRQERLDWYSEPDIQALLGNHPELRERYRAVVYDYLYLGHYLVLWNHRRPPLQDPRVRRSLTMLFDRPTIADKLMAGHARPSISWFRRGSPEYPLDLPTLPFDPPAARKMLEKAGVSLRLSIIYAAAEPLHRRIMELARPAFEEAGVQLSAEPLEWAVMEDRLHQLDFDGILLHIGASPQIDPYATFRSEQAGKGKNWMGYANPEVDRLLLKARQTLDPERRRALYQEFNRIFGAEQPLTLLAHPLSALVLHRRFRDATPSVLGLYPEKWWIPKR